MIQIILDVREKQGRLFLLGVGGSAGNCIHAVNDITKLCGIETYSPAENVAEFTGSKFRKVQKWDCFLVHIS